MSDIKHEPFFNAVTETIEGICSHRDELKIYSERSEAGVETLYVYPHQADYPKLVGAKGRTVNAIKHLFVRASVNLKSRLGFELEQSFVGRREDRIPFSYNPDFDGLQFRRLFETVLRHGLAGAGVEFRYSGEDVQVQVMAPRGADNETTVAALNALFYPYCFANGRMLSVRLVNHQT